MCLSRREVATKDWTDEFFLWPSQQDMFLAAINKAAMTHDLWYSPMIYSKPQRNKGNVSHTPCAWADLDTCRPELLLIPPTMVLETSNGRYQALWSFDETVEPIWAEALSKRIAYKHRDEGCDPSGWDLTQLLRVPYTYNFKYNDNDGRPVVKVVSADNNAYRMDAFNVYPQLEDDEMALQIPYPELEEINMDANDVLMKHRRDLSPHVWLLFQQEPKQDWSKALWQLELLLIEAGLSKEETLVVCKDAACNKFERDQRSDKALWRDVCRASQKVAERNSFIMTPSLTNRELLTTEERGWLIRNPSLVESYVDWGKEMGDAAWRYHQAGAFVALSSLLAGTIRLPTSYGTIVPNLWFMILADTTLTRKTTAMDMTVELIMEIDSDAILATDGSIEGLFTSLAARPGRPSIFLRDEFSGLLEMITKKDYYAGMAETLTKLYDGKFQKRVLRKETIEVKDPVLIMFAGGIRNRILQLLNYDHVASGFLPRFIFVTAESDVTTLKPLGPATASSTGQRQEIINRFRLTHNHYQAVNEVIIEGKKITTEKRWDAELTPDAWERYNKFEADLLNNSLESLNKEMITPTFDRLAKSGLKAAVLLAAVRQREERLIVEEEDLVRAFGYVEQWRMDTMTVLNNIGQSALEKHITQVYNAIVAKPGILRSELMRQYHLTSRDLNVVFDTLELRDLVTRQKSGNGEKYFPIGTHQQ